MGTSYKATCRACGNHFTADEGGGRRFEQLRCHLCGKIRAIPHDQVREPLDRFRKQLENPDLEYEDFDRFDDEYRRAVVEFAGACSCGGRLGFGAPVRCPACLSVDIDLGKPWRLYD